MQSLSDYLALKFLTIYCMFQFLDAALLEISQKFQIKLYRKFSTVTDAGFKGDTVSSIIVNVLHDSNKPAQRGSIFRFSDGVRTIILSVSSVNFQRFLLHEIFCASFGRGIIQISNCFLVSII